MMNFSKNGWLGFWHIGIDECQQSLFIYNFFQIILWMVRLLDFNLHRTQSLRMCHTEWALC